MGTYLTVVAAGPEPEESSTASAVEAAFAEVERWNSLLSNYDPTSPLSRVNAAAGTWAEVPRDLHGYLERARRDAARTDGAFDITIGGWFESDRDARARVGIDLLSLDHDDRGARARLALAGMALDPGGDGKGVALDSAASVLRAAGVEDALLDFGGSSWVGLGRPPDGPDWQITVADGAGAVAGTVRLRDRALSISASLRREAAEDGSPPPAAEPHILDPRTGTLVRDDRVVVVMATSATDAEVLSTALVIEGEAGFRWLERFDDAEAVILEAGRPPLLSRGARLWFTPR
jgi:thiamine biosynthesis lipoprotein